MVDLSDRSGGLILSEFSPFTMGWISPPALRPWIATFFRSVGLDADDTSASSQHCRPVESCQGHRHPDPGLRQSPCRIPPSAASHRRGWRGRWRASKAGCRFGGLPKKSASPGGSPTWIPSPRIGHQHVDLYLRNLPLRSHRRGRGPGCPPSAVRLAASPTSLTTGPTVSCSHRDDRALANHLLTLARDPAPSKAMGHKSSMRRPNENSPLKPPFSGRWSSMKPFSAMRKNDGIKWSLRRLWPGNAGGRCHLCWLSSGTAFHQPGSSPAKCSPATPLTPAEPIG